MNVALLKQVETPFMKQSLPNIEVGDTVNVSTVIRDEKGEKKRIQQFKGLVIAIKGTGVSKTITVRKISQGVGVEKIFPLHSPNVDSIEILRKGQVRQANIYYMRNRIGKQAMKVSEANKEIEMLEMFQVEPEEEVEEVNESEENKEEAEVAETEDVKEETVEEIKEEKKEE